MYIDLTTVAASAITASIIGGTQFIANRYLARILDRIEKEMAKAPKIINNETEGTKQNKP